MNPATIGPTGGPTNGEAVKIIIGAWSSFRTNICSSVSLTTSIFGGHLNLAHITNGAAWYGVSDEK